MKSEAYQQMERSEFGHWWFDGRRIILESVIKSFKLAPDCEILEVGSGTGGNLKMLSRFGSVLGVEMNGYARKCSQKKSAVPVIEGSLPDNLPAKPLLFDLICLFDVLEHVRLDFESLQQLGRRLNQGGRLLVTVPAHRWLWSRHDETLHHFRRYSKKDFTQLAEKANFTVKKISFFNLLLFPAALIGRVLSAISVRGPVLGTKIPWTPVNYVARLLFSAERLILPWANLPTGLSLLAVLESRATVEEIQGEIASR